MRRYASLVWSSEHPRPFVLCIVHKWMLFLRDFSIRQYIYYCISIALRLTLMRGLNQFVIVLISWIYVFFSSGTFLNIFRCSGGPRGVSPSSTQISKFKYIVSLSLIISYLSYLICIKHGEVYKSTSPIFLRLLVLKKKPV